jgi:hypothetical protein
LGAALVLSSLTLTPTSYAQATKGRATKIKTIANVPGQSGKTYYPTTQSISVAPPLNVMRAAAQEALEPASTAPAEIKPIHAPKGEPPPHGHAALVLPETQTDLPDVTAVAAPTPSLTGPSMGPTTTFKGEFLNGTSIPPDTMGAIGTTHVVVPSNNNMRITDRNGVELTRVSLNSFWAGTTIKGSAVTSAFDPKIYFDRFNSRFIFVASLNGPGQFSGMGVAVTQTADPTGLWNRYTVASDATSTAAAGHAIDYPSVGFNKNWIVVDENTFNYSGTAFTTYFGQQIFIFDKAAAYAGTLASVSQFDGPVSTCTGTGETLLGCGFTMAPTIVEDNTTDVMYMAEDWDAQFGQLRLTKITGTPAAPALTVGTQLPQSPLGWRFNAARIATSGGYLPQKDQLAYTPGTQRIMANDSRIQNAVLRGGSLWATHTVMLAATPTPAGTAFGTTNPDIHSGVQWWQVDPTIETGLATPPLQRGRIEDSTADNCNSGNSTSNSTERTGCTVANQTGTFFAFPNISVNMNNDVLIGFSQFSPLTYSSGAYAFRASGDPLNTLRDPVVYRPGQANYNLGGGTGNTTARQNRWGDYSAVQTDPGNDTDFWVLQEYTGTRRDFGIGIAAPWETYWAKVSPTTAAPVTNGNLIISELRLRGPQGVRDEYVELFNPGASPIIVNTTDNSEGWALATNNGTTTTGMIVIPNGTVIPSKGHLLVTDNSESNAVPITTTYSLTGYAGKTNPATQLRGADGDMGWSFDIADNAGVALFKTAIIANFSAATRMDAAGFAALPAGSLYKEGNGIPSVTASTPVGQIAFHRNLAATGLPQDTNANENDFLFVDTASETLGATPYLGAAGPENIDSPISRSDKVKASLIDPGCSGTAVNPASPTACARERNTTPVTNGALGTLSIRRKFTNTTGAPVARLRFRVVDVTGPTNQPAGTADVRVLTSAVIPAANLSGGGTTTIQGVTLEEPPTQSIGGGLNTSLSAGTITLSAPLASGASINVHFLLGVQVGGAFRFAVNVEALP